MSCVDACLEAIRRTPEMHAVVHENDRRGLVRRFPYAVFYEYAEDTVTSTASFRPLAIPINGASVFLERGQSTAEPGARLCKNSEV